MSKTTTTQWKEGTFHVHHCQAGAFQITVQREDSGQWSSAMCGLKAKARWRTVEEAKAGALRVWGRMFAGAAEACRQVQSQEE